MNRNEFFAKLDSSIQSCHNPTNFFSRAASIDVQGISAPSLRANLSLVPDKQLVAHLSIPFPPMEVGRMKLANGKLLVKSRLAGIDENLDFGFDFLPYIQCVFFGQIPQVYRFFGEQNFHNFEVYIENNLVVLRKIGNKFSAQIELNKNLSVQRLQMLRNQDNIMIECDDYKKVDNIFLPYKLNIFAAASGKKYSATIDHRAIQLNSSKILSYE